MPVNTSNSQDDLSELLRGDLSTDGLEGSSSCAVLEVRRVTFLVYVVELIKIEFQVLHRS